ncbi:MAG: PLP-dependent aminotransferase family protein [Actinobacteria bacterium]|nr:MAG: PLP-dependent aminotransferase family protein [Actinomycetota bacterium]
MAVISFARGVPAPECLPIEELADCAKAAIEGDGKAVLSYGPGGGYGPLREWIAARHGVEPSRVVVTSGSLQGFVFLAEQLVQPGARVLVEAPTYDRPIKILRRLGAEIVGLPMDDEGLRPDALERALASGTKPAFLYTIATFQNPSGRTLSDERRRRVVELAREHELLVLEDDPYGLVRYDGTPLPTLFELEGGVNVAYASSFSKTIAPGVRVGYFVLPADLAAKVEALAVSTYISPPFMTQATVHEFLRRGNFEPNLERVRGLLRGRRDAMLDALERHLPEGAEWSRPEGGYFVWVDLPGDAPSLAEAEAAGVTFVAGQDFFADGSGGRSMRLAFSFVSPDEIADGVARLAPLLARAATPAPAV